MDRTMFSGDITAEELEERHRGEYERLFPDAPSHEADGPEPSGEPAAERGETPSSKEARRRR